MNPDPCSSAGRMLLPAILAAACLAQPRTNGDGAASRPHGAAPAVCESRPTAGAATAAPTSCGTCHMLIYDRWSRGMHRYSYEDPIFQAAYSQAYLETAGAASRQCLRCHAPSAFAAGDFDMKTPVHRLGVQCDFCHSVDAVSVGAAPSAFTLRPGPAKASPNLPTGATEGHDVWSQPLLRSSEFCGGCHEFVADGGARIASTYSEWLDSPYASEGKTCQSCHMPPLERVIGKDGVVRWIKDHDLFGGHSSEQVRRAGGVSLGATVLDGDRLTVTATVSNSGSGHGLPTGIPSRRLALEVEVFSNGRVLDREIRVYRKVVGDALGRELVSDADIKLHGRRILSDNRIRPRESRAETFVFRVDPGGLYEVRATLSYVYTPLLLKPESITIKMSEASRRLSRLR